MLYARTKLSPDTGALLPEGEWQTLDEHLYNTALLVERKLRHLEPKAWDMPPACYMI